MSEAPRNYSGDCAVECGQCMQKGSKQLLLSQVITVFIKEDCKIPIHFLWHAVEVLPPALVCDVIIQVGHWHHRNG